MRAYVSKRQIMENYSVSKGTADNVLHDIRNEVGNQCVLKRHTRR